MALGYLIFSSARFCKGFCGVAGEIGRQKHGSGSGLISPANNTSLNPVVAVECFAR